MARPFWKGYLKFSLVTIAVRLYPAINAAATVKFHQLHRECQTRVQHRKWCPTCDREVGADEIVRGFEFERGRYVALEEKEIQRVRPQSTHTINLTQFVPAGAIDPILIDQPYFLAPDGKQAGETAPGKPRATPVVHLMDALRKSLAEAPRKVRAAKGSRKPAARRTRVVRFPERRRA
jgi:Ku protein